MSIKFSADEILKIAEKIEENGAAFYRRAAELHPEGHNKDFLNKLAAMEDTHLETFAQMRTQLSEKEREGTAYDPMDESLMYLKTLANQHGGEGAPDVAASLTGEESMEEVLNTAIGLEKKSILFYLGVKDMVPAKLGGDKIDHIIEQEKGHLVELSRELNAVRKGA